MLFRKRGARGGLLPRMFFSFFESFGGSKSLSRAGYTSFGIPVQRFTTAIRLVAALAGLAPPFFLGSLSGNQHRRLFVAGRLQITKPGWLHFFWCPVQRFTTAIRLAAALGGVHRLSFGGYSLSRAFIMFSATPRNPFFTGESPLAADTGSPASPP